MLFRALLPFLGGGSGRCCISEGQNQSFLLLPRPEPLCHPVSSRYASLWFCDSWVWLSSDQRDAWGSRGLEANEDALRTLFPKEALLTKLMESDLTPNLSETTEKRVLQQSSCIFRVFPGPRCHGRWYPRRWCHSVLGYWNQAGPCGAPGHKSLSVSPSLSSKGQVQEVAHQGREGIQRQGRNSQGTIVQAWGRVLVPQEGIYVTIALSSLAELKPHQMGLRC